MQTELEAYAFSGREDLTEIEIPAGIQKVGRYAFYNCRNLKKLYFHSDIRDLCIYRLQKDQLSGGYGGG